MPSILMGKYAVKYSFLVPVYNVEKYLEKCIDSLLNQDFSKDDYEILLVDDGSTDRSSSICDNYASNHTNVGVVHQENKGLLQARRTTVEHARGQYLVFIDSDDYVENELLSIVDSYINRLNPDFLMYGYYRLDQGKKTPVYLSREEYHVYSQIEMMKLIATCDDYNGIAGKVVRADLMKDHIEEIYADSINIGEDKVQTAYLVKYSKAMVVIRSCPYYYVIRDDSIVHKKSMQDIHEAIRMYGLVRSVFKETILDYDLIVEDSVFDNYDAMALQEVLSHIFKYDIRTDIEETDKIDALQQLMQGDKAFFSIKKRKGVKVYNQYRLWMLLIARYKALLRIDRFLNKVKKT